MVVERVGFHSNFGAFKRNRHSKTLTRLAITKSLFEKYICRVRTAHQPLKAPEGIK